MWNLGSDFGFARIIEFPLAPARRTPVRRDLCGLPPVLGRSGPFEIRLATTKREIRKAQRLRFKVFYEEGGAIPDRRASLVRRDICPFDRYSDHLLIVDMTFRNALGKVKPKVVGTYRLLRRDVADRHQGFYSQTEFNLDPLLARHPDKRFLELGRSCVHPKYRSKRVIELLWKGLWTYANHHRMDAMIGCASLPGINILAHAMSLSFLHHHAAADDEWQVQPRPGRSVPMAILEKNAVDMRKGVTALPPLLKAYVRVGARFGNGAVIDSQFGTIDVFTIVPLAEIEDRYIAHFGDGTRVPESRVA